MIDPDFWRGRRVLVTGHTGFKGSWLTVWLVELGADVVGLALPDDGDFDLFARAGVDDACDSRIVDLRDAAAVHDVVRDAAPEVVFHLAAQPLVRESYRAPVETWSTNVMGTIHLMDALRTVPSLRALVVVTSDKCYAHGGPHRAFVESDALGGHDPYSSSKAAVEIAVASFAKSLFDETAVGIATARAGNVIGAGDGGRDRLVPDLVRGASAGQAVAIRSPEATRPWQHVIDPLHGYLILGEALAHAPQRHAGAWNLGPDHAADVSVADIAARFVRAYGRGARPVLAPDVSMHEAPLLSLDSTKARVQLGWAPRVAINDALALTAEGYRVLIDGGDIRATMLEQIATVTASIPRTVAA